MEKRDRRNSLRNSTELIASTKLTSMNNDSYSVIMLFFLPNQEQERFNEQQRKILVNLHGSLSVEPQKFPPNGSNNSPDQCVNQGCYKTDFENIWKLNIPRSKVYCSLSTTVMGECTKQICVERQSKC
uniref:Uncharacterized protein n=1 Tax=Arundo donax TaxID=35708 RepID=A0A0A9FLX7_ARUDO